MLFPGECPGLISLPSGEWIRSLPGPTFFKQRLLLLLYKEIQDPVNAVRYNFIVRGIINSSHILANIQHDHYDAVPWLFPGPGIHFLVGNNLESYGSNTFLNEVPMHAV